MTGRQAHYLASLAARAGEEATNSLTRLEATERITALQGRTGRVVPDWAKVAVDLSRHSTAPAPEEPQSPAVARLAEARRKLREEPKRFEPLDVSAAEAIERLAEEGRLAEEEALNPPPPSFEPEPLNYGPPEPEADVELSRQRWRRPADGPGRGPVGY